MTATRDIFDTNGWAASRPHPSPVELRVPAQLAMLPVVRTLLTAIGTNHDVDLDTVADLRLAIDEACTALVRTAPPGSTLTVAVTPGKDDVQVRVSAPCKSETALAPGTFSWHVMSCLTDQLAVSHEDGSEGGASTISMTVRRTKATP